MGLCIRHKCVIVNVYAYISILDETSKLETETFLAKTETSPSETKIGTFNNLLETGRRNVWRPSQDRDYNPSRLAITVTNAVIAH